MGAMHPKPQHKPKSKCRRPKPRHSRRHRRATPAHAKNPERMTDDVTDVINAYDFVLSHWHPDRYPSQTMLIGEVATVLGIDTTTVFSIMKEHEMRTKLTYPVIIQQSDLLLEYMDNYDKSAIRKGVLSLFLEGTVPTLETAMEVINQDNTFPYLERTTFLKLLKELNFKYVNHIDVVIEREEIKQWRKHFLNKLNQYRQENRPIYYMDRRVIKSDHGADKTTDGYEQMLHVRHVKHLILMHIGNENGYVEDAIDAFESKVMRLGHEGMDAARFEYWFELVADRLADNAVVVVENAPYNCISKDGVPVKQWNKETIQKWLRFKNIPFDESDSRRNLMKKIDRIMATYQTFDFDAQMELRGIEVLRMPPYHSHLNAFSRIWPGAEEYVAKRNINFKLSQVEHLAKAAMANVTPDKWRFHVDHVINIEEEFYRNIDALIDSRFAYFTSHNTDSDSSEDSSYDNETGSDDD